MIKTYKFSGYIVWPYETPYISDSGVVYKYYTMLKSTPLSFTSLADARDWCKRHYLEGIFQGWIK